MNFILAQAAKKLGADKYISTDNPDFVIYIPQSISRNDSSVYKKLRITITEANEANEKTSNLVFILVSKAKKLGGDKYICTVNPDFTVYIPQSISRNDSLIHKKLEINIEVSTD